MEPHAPKAVFLSYARDDAAAARRIAEALRSSGLEVWFDENELRGGDEWDRKIRRQIDECTLFVPLISQHTEARAKGYFRLEWKLAVDQTQMLAAGVPFIAPVVIDDTREGGAVVPPEFMRVQWTRLPGALPTPEFVAQMKRLLDAPKKPAPTTRSTGATVSSAPSRSGIPPWVWAAATVVIGGGVMFFATRPSPKEPALPAASAKPAASTAPLSEARQLVARARALYEPWDLATPDNFALAEQLLKRAVALDPTEGETWAAYALLSCGKRVLFYDASEAVRLAACSQAEKAIKLAPESPQARFAWAFSLRFDPQTQDEAIRLLREEAARQPKNRLVVRTLGSALRTTGQLEQSLVYYDKAAALPGNDPVAHFNRGLSLQMMRRFDEAEAAYDEALAVAPHYAGANWAKLNLLLDIRRDLPRAQAHLAKIPPDPISNEFAAVNAYYMAVFLKDPARALDVLRRTNDYLAGNGPKATLTAIAHRMAGNEEAARSDLKAALRSVEERLVAQPNDTLLIANKAEILALQGERTAAEPLVREVRQRLDAGDLSVSTEQLAYLLMRTNQQEAALTALEAHFGVATIEYLSRRPRSKVSLRYDPVWDPLRTNPRFEALLNVPEQKK